MEFVIIVLGLAALITIYFCFGIFVKFMLAWWILVIGTPITIIVGFGFGWFGALIAIGGFLFLLDANNKWHSSERYTSMAKKVDKAFYLSDT